MTPKEKAFELINKFNQYTVVCVTHYSNGKMEENKQDAKQCALIAVDEILDLKHIVTLRRNMHEMELEYWDEVKQEIENL
jgi:hypothetical protein